MAGKLACSDLPVLFIVGPIGYQPNRGFHLLLLLLLLLLHHHLILLPLPLHLLPLLRFGQKVQEAEVWVLAIMEILQWI